MVKAEGSEKDKFPTFSRREFTFRQSAQIIVACGLTGGLISVLAVHVATYGEHDDAPIVVTVPDESAEAGPPMPNFDFIIPRRQTPGITYLLRDDTEQRARGEVKEGVQYAGYGTAPNADLFLLDTGAKITRTGDVVEVLPLYGPDQPIHLPLEVLGRAPASVAFQEHVLTIGTTPTDVHEIIDYMAPRNVLPPPGMFRQQG